MQEYELCVLFGGDQTSEQTDTLAENVNKLIQEAKANVKHYYGLPRVKLSYKIAGQVYGEYRIWLLEAESSEIQKLNKKLHLAQYLLRHMLVKLVDVTIEERIKSLEAPKKEEIFKEEKPEVQDYQPVQVQEEKPIEHAIETEKVSIEKLDEKLEELLEDDKI
jgi:ribosomal protein S6